jgi:hypothetical protein
MIKFLENTYLVWFIFINHFPYLNLQNARCKDKNLKKNNFHMFLSVSRQNVTGKLSDTVLLYYFSSTSRNHRFIIALTYTFTWTNCLRYTSTFEIYIVLGRDSLVSIVTCYGLDGPGIESRGWRVFPHQFGPVLGPSSLQYNGYRVFPAGKAEGSWRCPPTPI